MPRSPVAAIAETLAAGIRSGKLAPGTALPTHRQLAARHGVAIASASKVYAQLKSMGLVIGETGRGTFVRDRPQQREWDSGDEARLSASAVDLSFNHPTWPGQADLLRSMLRELAASGDLAALMHQQPPGGRLHERRIVAAFLAKQRGIQAEADRVFLVSGAQQGLDIATRALLAPHDAVAVDALTYPGFRMLASLQRLTLRPVPCLDNGPDLDALDALCRRHPVRAIYTMPTLHNPLGWVLTNRQRGRLVDIARRYDCLLIEDAAYAYLDPKAPPALAALAPERTIHVSSLSKSLASGLRFGYVVVPDHCAGRIKAAIRASYWSLPGIVTAMATRWMTNGTVARHETRLRREARNRQTIAREAFDGMRIVAHPTSMFLWLPLPEDLRMDAIATALAQRGIAVSKAEAYAATRHAPHALRLGLSSVPLEQLRSVLMQVRETIERFPI
ncbi:PLP-dependent aminotransferase family protein [Burkholderia sp. Ac-20365]|uniref:aminotransferase-like domain-containing protein n=1 Tax=Burkholderia sp. Ac-20365 TaxID=2703897 RepID=UPI00197B145B|nr:PLP-dependent aminotransferase family protein [Burkholderia sp. Ac-20365]MBN3763848.1 PLP-dependent aminotransferase family protein [Burkholderia sp. Ac-20365]